MGSKYSHLTEKDRIFVRIMLEKHYPKSKIASILKVDPSTIYREVKRNSLTHWHSGYKFYWSHSAQEKYLERRKRGLKLEKDSNLRNFVHSKLKSGWSPYQIEGRLKLENDDKCIISHESIYHYIYSDVDRRYFFHKYLQGVKANLITLRERRSRYLIAIKNKEAIGTALALINTILKNFFNLYKPLADSWQFYDNSNAENLSLIASEINRNNLIIENRDIWSQLMETYAND